MVTPKRLPGLPLRGLQLRRDGQVPFERIDSSLKRLTQHPSVLIGDGIESLDRFRTRLDVELCVAAGSVTPRLAFGW
jgi:hypothetical protein